MATETILIIEDNVEMMRILSDHFLKPLGYEVLEACDGEVGLATAVSQQPDLIMLDMHLPILDGLGVLHALAEAGSSIPIIFMTVFGSETLAIDAFRLGVRDYLIKPFTLRQAQEAIDNALQAQRLLYEKEQLSRNLVAAETVRQMAATLAHHINNHLMVAAGNLSLLREAIEYELGHHDETDQLLHMLENGETSLSKIEQILKNLQKITQIKSTTYFDETQILDIESVINIANYELDRVE
ncbi:MAG: response regulator [Anaerolineales bacterium]|nr:response regulator [Anaerolineales bacterium]MCB9003957.1 response regulator [Ardenticatenaceae bacterium]